jgi:hypothetical protein
MIKQMLLGTAELHLAKPDLPLLIHGIDGNGASLFSVSVLADLYAQGANIVFLCGYHMARDEFDLQTQSKQDSVVASEGFNPADIASKRVIFIPSDKPELLDQVLKSLSDSDERIIFFKNFDLFDHSVFSAVENLSNLVIMGDIDRCSYKTKVLNQKWATQLYFSIPKTEVKTKVPELEKYKGYLKSDSRKGMVSLVK